MYLISFKVGVVSIVSLLLLLTIDLEIYDKTATCVRACVHAWGSPPWNVLKSRDMFRVISAFSNQNKESTAKCSTCS